MHAASPHCPLCRIDAATWTKAWPLVGSFPGVVRQPCDLPHMRQAAGHVSHKACHTAASRSRRARRARCSTHASRRMQVVQLLHSNAERGLTASQVADSRREHGCNELPPPAARPFLSLILKQFDDLLVKILLAAAVVDFIIALANGERGLSAFVEPAVILAILAANAAVGVATETNAEAAISALKALEAEVATVVRDGHTCSIPVREVVQGDLVQLAAGEKVPADCYVLALSGSTLRVDQSILTGESGSVHKMAGAIEAPATAVAQDKHNIVFSGSLVASGRCAPVPWAMHT